MSSSSSSSVWASSSTSERSRHPCCSPRSTSAATGPPMALLIARIPPYSSPSREPTKPLRTAGFARSERRGPHVRVLTGGYRRNEGGQHVRTLQEQRLERRR